MNNYHIKMVSQTSDINSEIELSLFIKAKSFKQAYNKIKKLIKHRTKTTNIRYEIVKMQKEDQNGKNK